MMKPVAPMLAVAAEPFDSPEHLFEIKWDGVRGRSAIEAIGREASPRSCWLHSRTGRSTMLVRSVTD